jgi:hypothetical protein
MSTRRQRGVPAKRERLHIHADIEGTDLNGRSVIRVSGTYIGITGEDQAEFLLMDELLVTDDVCALFSDLTASFKRFKRN